MYMLILYLRIWKGNPRISDTGLGNVLYQVASVYGISKKYNIQVNYYYVNKYIEKINDLGLNHDITIYRNFYNVNNIEPETDVTVQETGWHTNGQFISDIIQNKDKNILIKDSHIQFSMYFNEYEKEIQELFSPDKESLEMIYNKYHKLEETNVINVSLHLRLECLAHITYKADFYKDAIEFIENKYKDSNITINYFVISDNIDKSKQLLSSLTTPFIYCENNFDYIDLWIMSLCHHNIVGHSTLAWWGAYLNKNKYKYVLYPSDMSKITGFDYINSNCKYNNWISIDSYSTIVWGSSGNTPAVNTTVNTVNTVNTVVDTKKHMKTKLIKHMKTKLKRIKKKIKRIKKKNHTSSNITKFNNCKKKLKRIKKKIKRIKKKNPTSSNITKFNNIKKKKKEKERKRDKEKIKRRKRKKRKEKENQRYQI